MKKILIVKTGATFPFIRRQYGDFEDFIIRQAGLADGQFLVAAVHEHAMLPEPEKIRGVIITGSHSMVTDGDDWCLTLAQWLVRLKNTGMPVLGICYGHQLLAHAYGGKVDYHPSGIEIGTADIKLTAAGMSDPLLSVLPPVFPGHVAHSQTVVQMPAEAVILAENAFEKRHAFSLYGHIWGVQFHPEFDAGITRAYIEAQKDGLIEKGLDIDGLYDSVKEHDYGSRLLKRFVEIAMDR